MNKVESVTSKLLNSILGIIIFIVSFSVFYLPYEVRIIPAVEQYLPLVRYICGGIVVFFFLMLFISRLRLFRDNWFLFAAMGLIGTLIFSTVMNHADDLNNALGTAGLAGIFLIMTIALFFKVNPKKYLLIAFFLLLIVNVINTYTVYAYWGVGMWESYGLYRNTFFSLVGNYNGGIEYVIPMAICGSAYAHRYGKWMEFINYPAMIMSLVMALKCESDTQVLAFAGILVFMILADAAMLSKGLAKVLKYIFQPVILWALNFVLFITVIVSGNRDWVAKFGLDPNFHNRGHIWEMSKGFIQANPIWGSGQETIGLEASKIKGYAHSHCTYLEIAYKTGFVGSVFAFLMLVCSSVAIYRSRNHRLAFIMSGMMFITGVAMLVETYPIVCVMLCFGLVYYICKNSGDLPDARGRVQKVKKVKGGMKSPDLSDTVKIDETVVLNAAELNAAGMHIEEQRNEYDEMINESADVERREKKADSARVSDTRPIGRVTEVPRDDIETEAACAAEMATISRDIKAETARIMEEDGE